MAGRVISTVVYLTLLVTTSMCHRPDDQRITLGENKLHELEKKTQSSSCWKEAVSRLNSTCRKLMDDEQRKLAVAFANCHLAKSGRQVYPCDDTMTIQECTGTMDDVSFQTYTEFFTHTGHICYFLQNELWQEKTDKTISRLSETSSETVDKLEQALEYHKELDRKQEQTLDNQAAILDQDRRIASALDDTRRSMDNAFADMNEIATKQKLLLAEMFGTLQNSVENVRYLMSLFLIEFVGFETIAVFVVACLVILCLPRFKWSRFKLYMLLFAELALEVIVRRLFGYFVFGGAGTKPPPEAMESLHSYLWFCRHLAFIAGIILYLWEFYCHRDPTVLLAGIQQNTDLIMERLGIESPTKTNRRASEPLARTGSITQGVQPAMLGVEGSGQGGPPPPTRHSWPVSRGTDRAGESETPSVLEQPPELTSSGTCKREESVDGYTYSGRKLEKLVLQPPSLTRGRSRQLSGSYIYEPTQGLAPATGHPHSPYTNDRISQYIAGLPTQFDSLGEQSFASTTAIAGDSDNDQSTLAVSDSESPLARQPLQRSSVNPKSLRRKNKNTGGGGVPSNMSPGNHQIESMEHEKEVSVEKPLPVDNLTTPKTTKRSRGHSRRSEPPATPTVTPISASRRRIVQAISPARTPHRYNLRARTPNPAPSNK